MSWLKYKICDDFAVGIFDNGKEMKFDIEDLEMVSSHRWIIDSVGYPSTAENGRSKRLHRILLDRKLAKGLVVDHINRDKLDNRKANLRVCTQKDNMRNASIACNNKSGVTGVFFDKKVNRWRAQVYIKGKTKHVGIFDDFEEAVKARKDAEKKLRE